MGSPSSRLRTNAALQNFASSKLTPNRAAIASALAVFTFTGNW